MSGLALIGISSPLVAAPVTWNNAGTAYSDGANWDGGAAPADDLVTDIATFDEVATMQPVLNVNRSVNGVFFLAGDYTFSGAGGTLSVGNGGISSSAGANIVSAPLAVSTAPTFSNTGTSLSVTGVVSGTGGVTIGGGTGFVLLSGANTFTGGVSVNSGTTLRVGNQTAVGPNGNTITLNGATLSNNGATVNLSSSNASPRAIVLNGGGTLVGIGNSGFGRIGNVTGTGGLTITNTGGGGAAATYFLDGTGSTYTGNTLISGGAVARSKGGSTFGDVAGSVTIDGASIISNGANQNYTSGRAYIIGAGGALLRAGDGNANSVDTYSNLQGNGVLTIGSQATATVATNSTIAISNVNSPTGNSFSGNIVLSSTTAAGGTSNSNLRIDGSLGSGASYGGVISGTGNFEYAGVAGTQTLTGNNSYTGTTAISSGTLLINGNQTSATGATTVASAAAIGGSGTLGGNLTIAAGGKFVFSLSNTLTVLGTVSLDSTFGIDDLIGISSSTADGTYTLIANGGDFSGIENFGAGNAFDLGSGKSAYFQNGSLQVVVVPEPTTFMMLLGGIGLLMVRRRRA